MAYRRIHVRVPITGSAILSENGSNIAIKAKTINVSQGGMAISDISEQLTDNDYEVEITTEDHRRIRFTARLMRQDDDNAGFQTVEIDEDNLQIISELVERFQTTVEYIEQIAEYDLLQQHFIDDDGTELKVTFETDP